MSARRITNQQELLDYLAANSDTDDNIITSGVTDSSDSNVGQLLGWLSQNTTSTTDPSTTDPVITVTPPPPSPSPVLTAEELALIAAKTIKALPIVLPAIEQDIFQDNKWIANKEGVNFKDSVWLSKDTTPEVYTLWIFSSILNFVSKPIEDIYSIDTPEELDCLNPYYLVGAWVATVVGPELYMPAYHQSLTFSENLVRLDVDYTNQSNIRYMDNATVFINTPLASVYLYAEIRFYFGDFITGEKINLPVSGHYGPTSNEDPYYNDLPNLYLDSETNELVSLKPIRPIYKDFTELNDNTLVELESPAMFNGRLITEGLHLIKFNPMTENFDVYFADKETLYANWNDDTSFWAERFEIRNFDDVDYMTYSGVENILNFRFGNLRKMPGRVFITSLKLLQPVLD